MISRKALSHLDLSDDTTGEAIGAVTPGDVLRVEFLQPMRLSARALARDIGVPANRITEIFSKWRALRYRRDRAATGAPLWHQPGVLDEPSDGP